MSKNYEVLRAAQKDLELFRAELAPVNRNGHSKARVRAREEILRLVQRVFAAGTPAPHRMVVFTAVEHGDGCSWVCARAGEALAAQAEGKVCLVDANVHCPMLHRYFGLDQGSGLVEAIMKKGPVLNFTQPVRGGNLWLLSGSSLPAGTAGVMSHDRLKVPLEALCTEFTYILVDAPPVNESDDAVTLGRLSNGVVLVIAANSTRRDAARRAKSVLQAAQVNVLGVVLNKRTFPIPEVLYRRI